MRALKAEKIGYWSGIVLVILGLVYLGLILVMMLSGSGFPPAEPLQSIFNALILITAPWMVFFWVILHQSAPVGRKIFSQASLALIVIFAALTSINRYVGLTVVKQSIASGNTNGLQWFLPYSWPSIMLALEFLAWGFFFGLACLSLAPVFIHRGLEKAIFWTLIVTGILSLLAPLGQLVGTDPMSFTLFTAAGEMGWGPGLLLVAVLLVIWFHRKMLPSDKYSKSEGYHENAQDPKKSNRSAPDDPRHCLQCSRD
jgi:hypothetical protein